MTATLTSTPSTIYSSPYPDLELFPGAVYEQIFEGLTAEEAGLTAVTELTTGATSTYGELQRRADAVAGYLAERGIGPGSVVSLQIPNSINFAVALFGIFRAGATVNPIGVLMNTDDVEKISGMAGADLFIGLTDTGNVDHVGESELEGIVDKRLPAPDVDVDGTTLASVPFSSGTTGMPKGVMLTHSNLTSNVLQARYMLERNGMAQNSATLSPLPFSHIYGMTALLLTPLLLRSNVHTMPKFDLETFLRAHGEHRIELTFIAPPMAVALAKHPAVDPAAFAANKLMFSGAAPLDEEIARAVERRLGTDCIQGYGMTETSPAVNIGIKGDTNPGSIGFPVPNTECRVVDIETLQDVPQGETGELLVRGPQVMQGYLNNQEATDETFVDGWLRTGDVARVDEGGHFYIVDRAKEVIKYKGYQVAPAELEALLLTHDAIADAGVVGVERDGLEIPRAFVVLQQGAELTADELMAWVAERVTPYKKVRAVTFLNEIPKNPTGKILRKDLRLIPLEA
ncbi:AMP-binding protein [Corynebacterium sp. p3-SID1145]|uniref:AMP-binding protein n=1 Tax=unclassified Corynebacterium TaxID=2624378 RepID=UPI0021AAB56A|nr:MULTISPECIES: AMP-binding protein [unclassified Corynebacterium]MCT1452690.1 AMP-binding protein [Corynebacterium sp. p3-SID1145]MCT1461592.1 AMP-binding protein [Corynebacterium sp. p3-SID1140]